MPNTEAEKSVGWVVGMVMLVIAAFGWAFMAAGYAHAHENWREGVAAASEPMGVTAARRAAWKDFLRNAVRQIPNCLAVLQDTVVNRVWLLVLFIVLEVLAAFGGYKMQKLEVALNAPPRRR